MAIVGNYHYLQFAHHAAPSDPAGVPVGRWLGGEAGFPISIDDTPGECVQQTGRA
jgi:hypothetical protein